MKFFLVVFAIICCGLSSYSTEIDRLLDEYAQIESVTCHIRRTVTGDAGSIQFISRVYWQNDDKLHVDNLSPIPRRIISDGDTFFSYAQGAPKGFSRPVNELSKEMLISLRKIPGTPMDHLLRLKGSEETMLPADDTAVKRVGIQTENHYVVLAFDTMDRLTGIIFYQTSNMQKQTAEYTYSNFYEAIPGVWIPLIHETILTMAGEEFTETLRVDRFLAGQAIDESLFIPFNFFNTDIDFVDDFSKIESR